MLINGFNLAKKIQTQLANKVKTLKKKPRLGVVLVGEDPSSLSYIKRKQKTCEQIGVEFLLFQYPKDITTRKLRLELNNLQKTRNLNGLIVQIPLPKHISTDRILDGLKPELDIDCLTSKNLGRFTKGLNSQSFLSSSLNKGLLVKGLPTFAPPIVQAVNYIFEQNKINLDNKKIVIIGAGRLVGKPIAIDLINKKHTVIVIDKGGEKNNIQEKSSLNYRKPDQRQISSGSSFSSPPKKQKNLKELTLQADVLISGVGQRHLIDDKFIKKGSILIDCGFDIDTNGKIIGDINTEKVKTKAKFVCPVPGGIGPLTTVFLLYNLIKA